MEAVIIDGEIDEGLASLFGAPWYMGRLAESDIVMPRNSSASSSRAIMAHEYGHFVTCSLMNEQDPDSLGILTVDVLFDGDELDPEDETRYLMEAFADFIAGQVTGGVNYFSPPGAVESGVCDFCSGSGVCLDSNLNEADTGADQIGRVVTTYHDAFDGGERGTLPTNGDSFRLEPSPSGEACTTPTPGDNRCLRYATGTYGLTSDEQVTLPVSAIPTWFFHWNTEATLLNALREEPMMKGLGKTMRDYGYNWCDACGVFAPHASLPSSTAQERFQACLQAPISEYIFVDPPNASGRVRASDCTQCPPLTVSDADGVCRPCGPGEQVIGNVCSPCTAGQIVTSRSLSGLRAPGRGHRQHLRHL